MARKTTLPTRETRLQAIGAYLGDIGPLIAAFEADDAVQRIRTFTQARADDVVAALRVLGGIEGIGIVVHGARGCAGVQVLDPPRGATAVTNLNQRDTIMGSDAVLARTIRALHHRHQPWAVFIVATPVVTINNDDARSVADELSEDLGIPVLVVRSDGFRSRIAATGFDAAAQAVLRLIPAAETPRRTDLVNLLAATADADALAHLSSLLAGLGLEANVLPTLADAGTFARAGTAALTVVVEPDATDVLAHGLEDTHGVPWLRLPPPIGLNATRRWLDAIREATGRPDREAAPEPAPDRVLDGVRVHLALGPAEAFGTAGLIEELGGHIVGLSVDHVDTGHLDALKEFAARHPDVKLHVAVGQPFEDANLLKRLAPDLLIGTPERAVAAARAGVPAVAVQPSDLLGFRGADRLARQARKALANTAFVRRLAKTVPSAYREGWLKRSPDWHIKHEVR